MLGLASSRHGPNGLVKPRLPSLCRGSAGVASCWPSAVEHGVGSLPGFVDEEDRGWWVGAFRARESAPLRRRGVMRRRWRRKVCRRPGSGVDGVRVDDRRGGGVRAAGRGADGVEEGRGLQAAEQEEVQGLGVEAVGVVVECGGGVLAQGVGGPAGAVGGDGAGGGVQVDAAVPGGGVEVVEDLLGGLGRVEVGSVVG